MNFVAIDVETANAHMRSICQIGLVKFEDGRESGSRDYLIDPGEEFDPYNVAIHGIDKSKVVGAPRFADIKEDVLSWTDGHIMVCHTHFDRVSIARACTHHSLDEFAWTWLDTARVARRAWPRYANSGFGLANLAKDFDLSLDYHDAVSDARAAGEILLRAIADTGLSAGDWIARCKTSLTGNTTSGRETRVGSGEGLLNEEVLVFTGSLFVPRKEAADLADAAGAQVDASVTKKTTMLVVGDQDLYRLAGATKSSKHRKAEDLIAKGQPIRVLTESDFLALVSQT